MMFLFSLHLKRHSHVLRVEIAKIATHLPTLGPHIILNEYNKSKLHVLYNEIFELGFFHESIVHGP